MLFSSLTFLYWFLPLTFLIYFLVPAKLRNGVLFFSSLLFYFWGEPVYSVLILFSAFVGWIHGLLIEKYKGKKAAKVLLFTGVGIPLALLLFFKYTNFFITNINAVSGANIPLLKIVLPIGISFYTFQILSYVVDVYRGDADAQHNFINFGAYVMLFPQLIAGPIVRYTDVNRELVSRTLSVDKFASGVKTFCAGLGKKVLIANVLAELVKKYQESGSTVLSLWVCALAQTLQIYFDFSGYSDMAIGMGKMLGFNFPENFRYPFISASVSEFWRRWHMTLGSWFRDYVYIPMGGNRVSFLRHAFNIFTVWFLTGFWHGAEWTFIIWGLYFGVILMLEKHLFLKVKIPDAVRRIPTLFIILISFVIFNAGSAAQIPETLGGMFGFGGLALSDVQTLYYLKSYIVLLIVAIIGSTPLPKKLFYKLKQTKAGSIALAVAEPVGCCVVVLVCSSYLIGGSYNPFLYFRF